MQKGRYGQWITEILPSGKTHLVWEPNQVIRINERIINSVAFFYDTRLEAEEGRHTGGSGFLVDMSDHDAEGHFIYAATAWHVLSGTSTFMRINRPLTEQPVIVELPVSKWIQDPEGRDLAICRVDMENFSGIPNAVSFDSLLSEGMVSEFDVGPGDEVFMSGRFTGFTGKDASPICRFGHIVSKPMLVEVEHGKFEEDYLIEVHSFSGHSGSPVFVYKPGEDPYKPGEDPAVLCRQDRIFLLGIEVGTRWRRDPVYQKKLPPPPERDANRFIQSATNISYVVPAWRLRDLLESDADARQLFTEQRKRRQEESGFGIMTTDDTDVEYFWRYDWEEF